jgi:hypothetical protein
MAPRLGYGTITRPAAIEFSMGNAEDSCYVWEDSQRAVIGFPGTQGDLPDWWTNFRVIPNRDGIHTGFAETAQEYITRDFRDYLRGAIAEGKAIQTCGMSQGAAHSVVVPWYLRHLHHITVSRIVHYGGPPCLLGHVAEAMDAWVPITRVVTPHDPVPCSWLPMRREGAQVMVPGCPGAEVIGVEDHDPAVYTRGIRRWCIENNDVRGVEAMDKLLYGEAV